MKLTKRQIASFQQKIFSWWPPHRRDLPWRRTRDPYRIMVSEVMLQQTQVSRVLAGYREFIERFPTIQALAKASPADVLRVWKGMGYNRRALYLHRAARIICDQHHGHFPINYSLLTKLPGLGIYTARAILVFAHGQEVPLVDTNIRQIITHFFFKDQPQQESVVEEVARQLIPSGKSWEWHQALMDYGAMELQKVNGKRKKERSGTIPFRQSNRYYRGRIIDRLRVGGIGQEQLIGEYVAKYGKTRRSIVGIVDSLAKDGLTERGSDGMLRLPGE